MASWPVALIATRLMEPSRPSPGHSGGAVPDFHRSSLFAAPAKRRGSRHQVRSCRSVRVDESIVKFCRTHHLQRSRELLQSSAASLAGEAVSAVQIRPVVAAPPERLAPPEHPARIASLAT
jgi:hypothetical protein